MHKNPIGVSVFGRQEKTLFFNLTTELYKKHGIQEENDGKRTSFHLSDENKLKKLLRDNGFVNITT